MHHAALNGHAAVVEELLRRGASVSSKDLDGYTPLHAAADGGCCQVIQVLAAKGADLNVAAKEGLTALAIATYKVPSNLLLCIPAGSF